MSGNNMEYAGLGRSSISEETPAGRDCRYEATFEDLQTEIDKLSSPTASGKVDWSRIVETAAGILQNQSKDLTVASYLAVGLLQQRQIDGLDQGLQILRDLVTTHWDHLYPPKKRMRGRAGAFTWWLEKSETILEQIKPDPIAAEVAARLQDNLTQLDAQLAEKMPDPPLLRPIQRKVEALPVQESAKTEEAAARPEFATPAPKRPEAAAAPPPAAKSPAASPAPAAVQKIESDQEAKKAMDQALQQLRRSSLFLLQQNLADPLAYRLRRMASWVAIQALPPNADGVTRIPVPPPQLTDELAGLRDEGNWPGLIQNCEQKMSQFIFWFDLQRMVFEGLQNLGGDHREAQKEVCRQTAAIVDRLPGLERLAFDEGTPFADAQTREWLGSLGTGGGSGAPAAERVAASDGLKEKIQTALGLARKKRLVDAMDLLQAEMQRSAAHRERMRCRLGIIQVLLAVKKSSSALPHIEKVLADIGTFQLEVWDPSLALEGLTAAWKGYHAQTAGEYQARGIEILNRIAVLHPTAALQLSKP